MVKTIIFLSLCVSMRSNEIEVNPSSRDSSLTFFNWNLSGLTAYAIIKISLLQAFVTHHNCDIICLFETLSNSSIQNDDDRFKIDGYVI